VLLQLVRSHIGVGEEVGTRKPFPLTLSRYFDAGAPVDEVLVLDAGDLDVDVDAVEQRATDPLSVPLHRLRGAPALPHRIAVSRPRARPTRRHSMPTRRPAQPVYPVLFELRAEYGLLDGSVWQWCG